MKFIKKAKQYEKLILKLFFLVDNGEIYLYFLEGEFLNEKQLKNGWQDKFIESISDQYSLAYWTREVNVSDVEDVYKEIKDGKITGKSSSDEIMVELIERPLIFKNKEDISRPLLPKKDYSYNIKEFWDIDKKIVNNLNLEEKNKINEIIKKEIGLNLNEWSDRIGNIIFFLPENIRAKTLFSRDDKSIYIKTNIKNKFNEYKLSLEAWDGDEYVINKLDNFDSPVYKSKLSSPISASRVKIYKNNTCVYSERKTNFLKGITLNLGVVRGKRKGKNYVNSEKHNINNNEFNWEELQRIREVRNEKKELEQRKEFVFYTPDFNNLQLTSNKAKEDLEEILNKADADSVIRIWDPYFDVAAVDLLDNIKDLNVRVKILNSLHSLEKINNLREEFNEKSDEFPERFHNIVCKSVYRSNNTLFHDRFILIGDSIGWVLGSSINNFGAKHTSLIMIPNPEIVKEVAKEFEKIWEINSTGRYSEELIFNGSL
jgi:hypothetical protein